MFGKRIKLFKLLGFQVSIDLSWIIIAILIAWSLSTGHFPFRYENLSLQTYWLMGIVGALGLFLSIIVHEFSHSLAARAYGMPIKGITLFIFGGVAEMENEPPSPKAEFIIAVMGPVSSIAIALIFYAFYRIGFGGFLPVPVAGVVGYLAWINAILATFNLVPAFPLDGGRILRSIIWGLKGNLRKATRISSNIGTGFGILLVVYGVFNVLTGNFVGGMWLALIGLFLQTAAKASYHQLILRKALEGETLSRFMKSNPVTVTTNLSIEQLVEDFVYKLHFKMFPVLNDNDRLVGCVTTKQVKGIPRDQWSHKKVGDIAQRCTEDNTINPESDAVEALTAMRRSGNSRLMVVNKDHLVGVIALKDMLKWLSLKMDLEPYKNT